MTGYPTCLLASEKTGCFPLIATFLAEHAKGDRVLYVPTAAYGEKWVWEPEYENDILPFERAGFSVEMFDLRGKSPAECASALSRSDAVFVGGGNTFFLLKHMRDSGFGELLKVAVEQDEIVYVGSSAGSVVATADIAYAASVDDPSVGEGVSTVGLGFVPNPVLPHFDHPSFGPAVEEIALSLAAEGVEFVPLGDKQAIFVSGNSMTVIDAPVPQASLLSPSAP